MTIIANKAYKNLNCKIDKSVSDKLEKFIADTKLSKTATVDAYSARTAHPFQRNGAPFRFKLSKAQQVD